MKDDYLDTKIKKKLIERMPYCVSCGTPYNLDRAHIFSCRFESIRWDILNLVSLCRICHSFFTDHPNDWDIFWRAKFPERVEYLENKKRIVQRTDRKQVLEYINSL